MSLLFTINLLAGKVVQAFCWMLIHSLWQGLLFTIITGVVIMLTIRSGARLRYNIISVLFFLFIALCGFTFNWELNYTNEQTTLLQAAASVDKNGNGVHYLLNQFLEFYSSKTSLVAILWFVVFCIKGVKIITALVYNSRVKHHKISIHDSQWKDTIERLCARLEIKKRVDLFESEIVKIPIVIGHLKPIIFIPIGLLTNLPAGEVEAILLHELAHIRRNDYLVNMMQLIAESIFFFNPALLWMSAMLREERENCCDDIAINETRSKKQFIQALISFREHTPHASSYTTAFPARKNKLLKRVSRIIHNRNNTLNPVEKTFWLASFVLLAFFSIEVSGIGTKLAVKPVQKETIHIQPVPTVVVPLASIITPDKDSDRTIGNINAITPNNRKESYNNDKDAQTSESKQVLIKAYTKTIIDNATVTESYEPPVTAHLKSTLEYDQQVELYRQQMEKDRQQVEKDRTQAALDRIQAQKDREQADKDRKQAELDRIQADKDRLQAQKDRLPAEREKLSLQANI